MLRYIGYVAMPLLACALAACSASPVVSATPHAPCPDSLVEGIRLSASVAQVTVPDGVRTPSGSVKLIAGVGRRILLSADVPETLPRVRLINNSLSLYTFGGTLAGWARVVQPAGAVARESIQVSGGLLRIAPFLPGNKLRTYTQTFDVLVIPGGAPAAGLVLHTGPMWDGAGRPTAPDEFEIALDPILHMSVLDTVNATAQFDFLLLHRAGAHERWECSVQSKFLLVDHDSVLPDLWTLQASRRRVPVGRLVFYNPGVGAFPVMFDNPAVAAGFARWLSETHATRVGKYQIGLMAAVTATGFQPVGNDATTTLAVKQLGST